MNVVIVNGYHDSNKGSCAIAWGLIRRLENTGLVESISLVSMFREDSTLFRSGFRHLRENFKKVNYLGSPILGLVEYLDSHITRFRHPIRSKIWVGNFIVQLLKLGFSSPIRMAENNRSLKAILESDLVVERGGPFLAAGQFPLNFSLYYYLWPIFYANKAGIPYGFAPESIGPIENPLARKIVGEVFRKASFFSVREDLSRSELLGCGVGGDSIHTMLDSAFWVKPRLSERLESVLVKYDLKGSFLAVVCREWTPRDQERYHRELAAAIDQLVPRIFHKVALIMNAYGPMGGPDDTQATRQLYEFLSNKGSACVVEEDLAPDELSALYGQAGLLIGTRLHSVILALTGGTPVVAVSYGGPKTRGIMKYLGMEMYVENIATVNSKTILSLVETAKRDQVPIINGIDSLRKKDDRTFLAMLQSVHLKQRL